VFIGFISVMGSFSNGILAICPTITPDWSFNRIVPAGSAALSAGGGVKAACALLMAESEATGVSGCAGRRSDTTATSGSSVASLITGSFLMESVTATSTASTAAQNNRKPGSTARRGDFGRTLAGSLCTFGFETVSGNGAVAILLIRYRLWCSIY
jgi:hypothetical protein